MKNLDLNGYGVLEMNAEEMKQTDGGSFLVGFIIGFVVSVAFLLITKNGGEDPDCPNPPSSNE